MEGKNVYVNESIWGPEELEPPRALDPAIFLLPSSQCSVHIASVRIKVALCSIPCHHAVAPLKFKV